MWEKSNVESFFRKKIRKKNVIGQKMINFAMKIFMKKNNYEI